MNLKKVKNLLLDENLLIELFNFHVQIPMVIVQPVCPEMPEGSIVLRIGQSMEKRCLIVTIQHDSFDEVSDFVRPPEVCPKFGWQNALVVPTAKRLEELESAEKELFELKNKETTK